MYGLVLEGGGAKGAYQVGSYFALMELGYKFEMISGTSIGAINGAFIAMGEPEKCANIWKTLSLTDFPVEDESLTNFDEVGNSKFKDPSDIIEIAMLKFSSFIKQKQISVEPLKRLVNDYIDEDKIRKSNMDFGLVTINISDKRGEELTLKDIPYGKLNNYLIASAYFPFFQLEQIDGKFYLDGGFYNNIPFEMVVEKGLTPIIIRTNPNDIMDRFPEDAIVIAPRKKYTTAMNFDPVQAEEIMRIGYFDTYKTLKGLYGKKYYINKFNEDEAFLALEKIFFNKLDKINLDEFKHNSKYRILFEELIPRMASDLGVGSNFNYVDFLVTFLEREAEKLGLDLLKIYNLDELVDKVVKNDNILEERLVKSKKLDDIIKKLMR